MGENPGQALNAVARYCGVRVQCKYIADRGQNAQISDLNDERISRFSMQYIVEFSQFAALALPTHPRVFGGIPDALAMKKVER